MDRSFLPASESAVIGAECVDNARSEFLRSQRNCADLPIRDAKGVSED